MRVLVTPCPAGRVIALRLGAFGALLIGLGWIVAPSASGALGSWASPSDNQGGDRTLNGVSCVSAQWCTAVGSSSSASGLVRPLAESWDGATWSVAPGPSLATSEGSLNGVSCVSAKWCTAVGNYGSATLVESWDGATWSVVPSPTPGTYGGLSGVSCSSYRSCTAVGNYSNGTGSGSSTLPGILVESWNGATWSAVPAQSPSVAHLYGVSCATARSCKAVGDYASGSGLVRSLAASSNGSAWSLVPSPSARVSYLYGVSCATADSCKAVGQYTNSRSGVSPMDALVESWNGTAWSL